MNKLTLLLVVSFVVPVAGQQAYSSHAAAGARPPAREVARVNGVSLTSARLNAALNALIPLESFHRGVGAGKLDELRKKALDRIVAEELQYQEGVRVGVLVPDDQLQKEMAGVQQKYGTRAALEAALQRSGATMTDLRRELHRTLTVNATVRRAVTARCEVSRDEASRFFALDPNRFVEPEQLHLYSITIGVPPSANARQWADAKQRAEEVRRKIKAGVSFQAVARTYSTDATRASGGDMGFLHRGAFADEFERATRNLPLRQPSNVVQTLYGYHVVEIFEVRPSRRMSFNDVAQTLQTDLTTKRCASMKETWIAALRARSSVVFAGEGV
jgi:parvulin-like peptidyl-prolyl isomerase